MFSNIDLGVVTTSDFETDLAAAAFYSVLEADYVSFQPMIGIERRRKMNKFMFFYGFDTGVNLVFNDRRTQIQNNNSLGTVLNYTTEKMLEVGLPLNFFIGLKYQILPNLSVSVKSSLNNSIYRESFNRDRFDNDGFQTTSKGARYGFRQVFGNYSGGF
ncbi:MAG: hypothetical protein ACI9XO_001538 [Paraglaciecola sp.]